MKLAAFLLSGVFFLAACGVGDDDGGDDTSGTDKRLCTTTFALTGQYTLGSSPPDRVNNETQAPPADGIPDIQGCWPTGTWSFSLTATEGTCTPAPAPPTTVAFRVDFVDDAVEPRYTYTLTQPASGVRNPRVSVSQGGGGTCEGIIELFNDNGKEVYNLTPYISVFNQSGPISGQGEFSRWNRDQTPGF
ncbi:MAG: hypothetical protein KF773_26890 [Deltaproteobacteria bacterium]|nr:hypothetical protein [Deltaproteobacteria bacterium]MCW5803498.1 hypothetical protein [Deltaproteobacteria bacterium]